MTENPCRKCNGHGGDCHAYCVMYKEWQKANDERNEKIRKARKVDVDMKTIQRDGRETNGKKR